MRIALVAGLLVTTAPAVARAGKPRPSVAEATKAAQAWLAAMTSDDPDGTAPRAKALTATPFFSYAAIDGPDPAPCPSATATDARSLGVVLTCLGGVLSTAGSFAEWTPKRAKPQGMARAYKQQLAAWARTGTVVELEQPCEGVFNDVLFATVKDDRGAVKIAAVLSVHGECGE
jgi:hypothetical protein